MDTPIFTPDVFQLRFIFQSVHSRCTTLSVQFCVFISVYIIEILAYNFIYAATAAGLDEPCTQARYIVALADCVYLITQCYNNRPSSSTVYLISHFNVVTRYRPLYYSSLPTYTHAIFLDYAIPLYVKNIYSLRTASKK